MNYNVPTHHLNTYWMGVVTTTCLVWFQINFLKSIWLVDQIHLSLPLWDWKISSNFQIDAQTFCTFQNLPQVERQLLFALRSPKWSQTPQFHLRPKKISRARKSLPSRANAPQKWNVYIRRRKGQERRKKENWRRSSIWQRKARQERSRSGKQRQRGRIEENPQSDAWWSERKFSERRDKIRRSRKPNQTSGCNHSHPIRI